MRLPVSYARIEINEEKEFRLNKNFAYIPIRIFDHKSQVSSSIITISLKLYRPVFIARKKVGAKENLSSSMFERKLADVGSIEERVFEDFDGLSSYRSKILIKEGMILSKEMVEMIPLIFKGDKVVLHSNNGSVDVNLDVVSRQDGCAGDIISVQAKHALYKGKIIDKYNLILEE